MGNRVVRKFIPVNKYDSQGIISWLNFMAEQGLILKKIGRFFAEFETEQFEKVEYLLMAQDNKKSSLEILGELEKQSWRFKGDIGAGYAIYCIINPTEDNEGLHDKVKVDSAATIKRLIWANILSPALPLLVFAILEMILVRKYAGIPWLFMSDDIVEVTTLLSIFLIFLCIVSVINIHYIRKFKSYYTNNSFMEVSKIRKSMSYKMGQYVICSIFAMIILGGYIFTKCTEYKKTLEQCPISSSILKLSEIEADNTFIPNHLVKDGYDISNSVHYAPTILISEKYDISQYGHVAETSQKDTTRVLRIKNIKCRTKLSSQLIFSEEINQKNNAQQIKIENLDNKGKFEKLVYGKQGDEQYILGYKDNKITFVNYVGEEDIKQYVDDIYKMLEAV